MADPIHYLYACIYYRRNTPSLYGFAYHVAPEEEATSDPIVWFRDSVDVERFNGYTGHLLFPLFSADLTPYLPHIEAIIRHSDGPNATSDPTDKVWFDGIVRMLLKDFLPIGTNVVALETKLSVIFRIRLLTPWSDVEYNIETTRQIWDRIKGTMPAGNERKLAQLEEDVLYACVDHGTDIVQANHTFVLAIKPTLTTEWTYQTNDDGSKRVVSSRKPVSSYGRCSFFPLLSNMISEGQEALDGEFSKVEEGDNAAWFLNTSARLLIRHPQGMIGRMMSIDAYIQKLSSLRQLPEPNDQMVWTVEEAREMCQLI